MQTPQTRLVQSLTLNANRSRHVYDHYNFTQGDKGQAIAFDIDNAADLGVTYDILGWEISKPDGNLINVHSGFTGKPDTGFVGAIPDEAFTCAGDVICRVYAASDTIKATTETFTLKVAAQLEYDGRSSSYNLTFESLQEEMTSTLATMKDKVAKAISGALVSDEVAKQLKATQDSITAWEKAQKAAMEQALAGDTKALKDLQAKFNSITNSASALLADLQAQGEKQAQATKAANDAAGAANTATTAANKAKADADTATAGAKASAAEADKQAQAAQSAAKQVTDQGAQIKATGEALAKAQAGIDALHPEELVKTVGGQKPDGTGNIIMDAYVTKDGNNAFSGSNSFASRPTIGTDSVATLSDLQNFSSRNLAAMSDINSWGEPTAAAGTWSSQSFKIPRVDGKATGAFVWPKSIKPSSRYTMNFDITYLNGGTGAPALGGDTAAFQSTEEEVLVDGVKVNSAWSAGTVISNLAVKHHIEVHFMTRAELASGASYGFWIQPMRGSGKGWPVQIDDLVINEGPVAAKYSYPVEDITALNNKISALEARLSGGY